MLGARSPVLSHSEVNFFQLLSISSGVNDIDRTYYLYMALDMSLYHDQIVQLFTHECAPRAYIISELKKYDPQVTHHKLLNYIREHNIKRLCKFCKVGPLEPCRGVRDYCKICAPTSYSIALIHSYGINQPQYDVIYTSQQGLCAMCGTDLSSIKANVDHNHETGQVRGILCHTCNIGLGFIEKPGFIERARTYLTRPQV
jgi:hypothetical protein